MAEHLRKVLLGLEAAGHGNVQDTRPARATSPSHALFCCVIQTGAASRPSTRETFVKNELGSTPPIAPFRSGTTRLRSWHAPALGWFASGPDRVRLAAPARSGSGLERHRPVPRLSPARWNPETMVHSETPRFVRHSPP